MFDLSFAFGYRKLRRSSEKREQRKIRKERGKMGAEANEKQEKELGEFEAEEKREAEETIIRAERLKSRLMGICEGFEVGASVDVKKQEDMITDLESRLSRIAKYASGEYQAPDPPENEKWEDDTWQLEWIRRIATGVVD